MRSRKNGNASLKTRTEQLTGIFSRDINSKNNGMQSVSLLEACQFFIKEMNNHCAEYEAGEYGEKSSNAWTRAVTLYIYVAYLEDNNTNTDNKYITIDGNNTYN